jgi:hypothetical protein
MRRDVLRRVRWANVALACAVVAALVMIVVWPLVVDSTPALPPDAPRPLVAPESSPQGATEEKGRGGRAAVKGEKRPTTKRRRPARRSPASKRSRGAQRQPATSRPGAGGSEPASRGTGRGEPHRPALGRWTPSHAATPPAAPRGGGGGGEFGFEGGG